jgi:hypothetical protein
VWLANGSCIRLRPLHRNHMCSWDFVMDHTYDDRPIEMLPLIDEYTKKCMAIHVARRIRANYVVMARRRSTFSRLLRRATGRQNLGSIRSTSQLTHMRHPWSESICMCVSGASVCP